MKRSEQLASTVTPDGLELTLSQHSGNYSIEINGRELMSSRAPGSEKAMSELAVRELSKNRSPRVLIGGLGLGFTLGAALDAFPARASIVVVEYFATIVDWNRKFSFHSERNCLADSRVRVVVGDVVDTLRNPGGAFDAILLDVDNGPDAFTVASNARLYDRPGLERIRRALNLGGVLAVWSAEESPIFQAKLSAAGFSARSESVRSRGKKGERHTIFVARN